MGIYVLNTTKIEDFLKARNQSVFMTATVDQLLFKGLPLLPYIELYQDYQMEYPILDLPDLPESITGDPFFTFFSMVTTVIAIPMRQFITNWTIRNRKMKPTMDYLKWIVEWTSLTYSDTSSHGTNHRTSTFGAAMNLIATISKEPMALSFLHSWIWPIDCISTKPIFAGKV